jgi:hypothetical protein
VCHDGVCTYVVAKPVQLPEPLAGVAAFSVLNLCVQPLRVSNLPATGNDRHAPMETALSRCARMQSWQI